MSKREDIIRALDLLDEFRALAIDIELLPSGYSAQQGDFNYRAVVSMRDDLHRQLGRIEYELMEGNRGNRDQET